jgi:4-amino-4-deoxy-L-arabinose transferase-like glycosyltransferase
MSGFTAADSGYVMRSGSESGTTRDTGDAGTRHSARTMWLWLAAAMTLLVLWFALLEERALWDPDEGRYAEIPREMVTTGDWVTPRLNALLYFEKPPLQYWATAVAYELMGQHNWTARLWSALTGLAGVLLVFYAGRRLHSTRAGLYAASILASSLLYFGLAHLNTLDSGLTFFLSLAVCALALGLKSDATALERRTWIAVAWVGAGFAVLSKGLIGVVLPVAALMWYAVLCRDHSIWPKLSPISGAVLLLLITVPWFVAVARAHPDFTQFFFVHEHYTRFTTTEHHRGQPWWFFVPVLALGALPWTVPMLCGLWQAFKERRGGVFAPFRFLAVWAVIVFVFFSVSGSKLVPYVLPAFPALALLAGRYVCTADPVALARQLFWSGVAAALLLAVLPYAVSRVGDAVESGMIAELKLWCMWVAALWGAGAVLSLWAMRKGKVEAAVIGVALSVTLAHQIALAGAEKFVPGKSSAGLAQQIKPYLSASTHIYTIQMYPQSLPFYLGRTVTLVDFRDELDFGLQRAPEKSIPSIEAFREAWRNERDAIAVMSKTRYDALATSGMPMMLIGQDARTIAVRRP